MSREYYKQQNKGNAVSYSRLSTFNGCQYEYYLNYILKKPKIDNIYGKIGGDVHEIIQSMQEGKLTNEEGLDKFFTAIDDLKLFGYSFPSEKVEKNFIECVSHYIKHFKPIKYNKQDVEIGYDIYVGNKNTLVLGFIDLLIHTENNEVEIYDYKTSSKYSKADFEEHKLQLLGYARGVEKQYGLKPVRACFDMLKYCNIEYIDNNKKVKSYTCVERNNIGSKMRDKADIMLNNIENRDIILDKFEKTNEIPEQLKDRIFIKNYYKEVDLSQINEFDEFVDKTITKINDKKISSDYKPKYITERTSFYCNILCGQKNNCKYYKYYLDKNIESLKQAEEYDELDDLL